MKKGYFTNLFIIIFVTIIAFSFVNPNPVFAQSAGDVSGALSSASSLASDLSNGISGVAGFALKWGPIDDIIYEFVRPILVIWKFLSGLFLAISGGIFDFVLQFTVSDVSNTYKNYFEKAVKTLWVLFRDFGNIVIIFSLLYLAIKTILQGNGFADKKNLSMILIAAILMNFSLFFTKIVFDASNIVSIEIYKGISGGSGAAKNQATGLATQLVQSFGIIQSQETQSLGTKVYNFLKRGIPGPVRAVSSFGYDLFTGNGNKLDDIGNDIAMTFMIFTMSLFTGIIFLFAALTLIMRLLIFVFLMATSALGLIGSLIPFLRPYMSSWWKHLWKQAVALPVFMLMFYVSFLFIRGTFADEMKSSYALVLVANSDGFAQAIRMMIFYIFSMLLLLATIMVPGKIGDKAASMALKSSAFVGRGMGRVLSYGSGTAGRYTIGLGARQIAKMPALKALTKGNFATGGYEAAFTGFAARQAIRAANNLGEKRTYDPRNIKFGKKTLGDRLGIGEGVKSYEELVKKESERLGELRKKEEKMFGWKDRTPAEEADYIARKAEKTGLTQEQNKNIKTVANEVERLDKVGILPGSPAFERIMKPVITKFHADEEILKKKIEAVDIEIGLLKDIGFKTFQEVHGSNMSKVIEGVKFNFELSPAMTKLRKTMDDGWKKDPSKKNMDRLEKLLSGK